MRIPDCISVDRVRNSRLNKRELDEVYKYLVFRDGEKCSHCGMSPPFIKLEVHHIDGNKFRHFHKNLELTCHKCNCKSNPKGWKKKLTVSLPLSGVQPSPEETKLYLKKKYLPGLLNYLEEYFHKNEMIVYENLITVAAFKCGMASKKTMREYIELLSCEDADAPLLKFNDNRTGVAYISLRGGSGETSPDYVSKLFKEFRKKYCS